MLTLVELCAGVGTFSLAFENKNVKTIFANDFDKNCKKTFDLNFDIKLDTTDLNKIDLNNIPKMDILTAGFSCQPFSIAGKRLGFEDERSNVFWTIINIIKKYKPKCIILENVKNLLTHNKKKTFFTIKSTLENNGYTVLYKILNTSEVTNIPQNRERVYIVCFLNKNDADLFEFPETSSKLNNISEYLESSVDDKYYYDKRFKSWDLIERSIVKHINTNTVYQFRRKYIRENKSNVVPCFTRNMGSGGHNVSLLKDDKGIRKLTPRECFNLQGFPKSYKLSNICDSYLYQQVGNCITLNVIKLIADKIINILS